ncbi:MAG: alpha/beta hydrolase-fold protein [Planctomycetota bacterium]|nr:alpha/beta hydrolase-fold protein [Planctomycetota bacterium]
MSPAIDQLLEGGVEQSDVDAFMHERQTPIVEGPSVTFVWRGEADEVNVRHFIYGLGSNQAMWRVDGTDLWYRVVEIPPGSRFEYKIEVVRGANRHWIRDPHNPYIARDPFGANSVVQGAGYAIPSWIHEDPDARPGSLEEVSVPSDAMGGEQPLVVYTPARMRNTLRYPVLIAFDGLDYVRYASLKIVLDNLIHRHEIPPMVVALSPSADRFGEYTANEAHARYVADELMPWLVDRYPLRRRPADRGLMGASLGGVAALSTAWRHPGRFGRLFLQSGSFAFTDIGESDRGPVLQQVVPWMNAFRRDPGRPAERMFISCGMYESLIYENRSLAALLQGTENVFRYEEARDGHNWENWRDRLRAGLSWLFPGPLMRVYE